MSGKSKRDEVIPSARRLVNSLRDLGYDFAAAVADLVDNSIAAHSRLVAIDIEFDGDDSWVRIADNGRGMTPPELKEAMRYGAEREYDKEDLGKFGLGLKTASLSQCQRLSVASRTNPNRADVTAFCWDLDHIEKTNRWEILRLDRNGLGPAIRGPLKETTGTVVLWQRLDRILGFRHPYGESARKRLSTTCRELEVHLAMVFHRFLTGEVPRRKLKILINGNEVIPWDPFARNEPNTKVLTPVPLKVEHEGVTGDVQLEPFVLPPQNAFSSPEAWGRASGPANWNQQQGFYIYRGGRLIQSGGWSKLRTADEHTKLARVALSFLPALDEAFKINVAKMRVQLPQQIRDQVEQAIKPVVKMAKDIYGKNPVSLAVSTSGGGFSRPPAEVPTKPNTSPRPSESQPSESQPQPTDPLPAPQLWNLDDFQAMVVDAAELDEKPVVTRVFTRLRGRLSV